MLCTAPRRKIKFVMFLISNAPSFLASCHSHAVRHAPGCSYRKPCVLWLCPAPQPPLCQGCCCWRGWVALRAHSCSWWQWGHFLAAGQRAVGAWRSRGFVPAGLAHSLVCKLCLHGHLLLWQMGLRSAQLLRQQRASG